MKVGISFPDNDFYRTLRAFMQSLVDAYNGADHERYKRRGDPPFQQMLTKKRIVILFNALAYGLYHLKQNQFPYDLNEDSAHLQRYLRIETKHVFLGSEIDHYIEDSSGWANGEFQYVDLGVSGEIKCL